MRSNQRDGAARVAIYAVVTAPLVVALIRVLTIRGGFSTTTDLALIESQLRRMPAQIPMTGVFSRFGWSHPGPLLYFALWPAYLIALRHSVGLAIGALAINCASVVAMLRIAKRHGTKQFMAIVALAIAILLHALGPDIWISAWNPHITVLPFALFLFLAMSVACDGGRNLVWFVLVASFLVQSHVEYAGSTLTVGGVTLAMLVIGARRGTNLVTRRQAVAASIVAGVVWALPLGDAAWHRGGNFRQIFHYFHHPHTRIGLAHGWNLIANEFTTHAMWIVGRSDVTLMYEPTALFRTSFPVVLVAIAVGFVYSAATRRIPQAVTLAIALLGAVAGVASISSIGGFAFEYLTIWILPLGLFGWVALANLVCTIAHAQPPRVARTVTLALLAVMMFVTAINIKNGTTYAPIPH